MSSPNKSVWNSFPNTNTIYHSELSLYRWSIPIYNWMYCVGRNHRHQLLSSQKFQNALQWLYHSTKYLIRKEKEFSAWIEVCLAACSWFVSDWEWYLFWILPDVSTYCLVVLLPLSLWSALRSGLIAFHLSLIAKQRVIIWLVFTWCVLQGGGHNTLSLSALQ